MEQYSPLDAKAYLLQFEMMLFACVGEGTVDTDVVVLAAGRAVRDGWSLLIATQYA